MNVRTFQFSSLRRRIFVTCFQMCCSDGIFFHRLLSLSECLCDLSFPFFNVFVLMHFSSIFCLEFHPQSMKFSLVCPPSTFY